MLTRLLRTLPSTSQLVDVREASEIAAGLPAAIHIPLGQLPASRRRLDHGRPVAFLCRSASRSAAATREALAAGLDATNVSGGVTAWARQGHPLRRSVRTTDAPSPREPEHGR
jgi:rhodanese-related sulfurtransferase